MYLDSSLQSGYSLGYIKKMEENSPVARQFQKFSFHVFVHNLLVSNFPLQWRRL
jgi:hypothetical protein